MDIFFSVGSSIVNKWKKGDIITWDPYMHHCGCNGGMKPKVTMNITGLYNSNSYINKKIILNLVMSKFISIHYGHNATVAYSNNGEILSIISEERFSRIKNHTGFPEKALNFILNKYFDDNINKVEKIILVDNYGLDAKYLYKNKYKYSEYISFYSKLEIKINQRNFFMII